MRKLFGKHEFYLGVILVVLVTGIGIANPAFFTLSNLFDLCKSSTVMGLFALGVLVVLISGGIDISFAAIGAFSMYVTSRILLAVDFHGSVSAAFLLAGIIGLVLGLFNAVFITVYRLPTLIVTLGSASMFRGFLLAFIGTSIVNNLPAGMLAFSKHTLFERTLVTGETVGLSSSFVLYVLAIVVVAFILRYTLLGRGIYAMGGNAMAAECVGFNLRTVQFFIYGFVGLLSGTAGLVHACTMRNANPFDLVGGELAVIAAVVLGGASITGGRGTVVGTVLGVSLIVVVSNSLILLDIPSYWQKVFVGSIIIASIGISARKAVRTGSVGLC